MADTDLGTADDADVSYEDGRINVYTWENADGISVVQYGFTPCAPTTAALMRCPFCGTSWSTSAL